MTKKLQQILDTVQIIVFIVVIFIPLLAFLVFTPRESSDVEQRDLTHDINVQIKDPRLLLNDFETLFGDQLAYRDNLVRGNALISVKLFHESPVAGVVVGKNGWLFYTPGLDDYRGLRQFTDKELAQWKVSLEAKRDWLASYGADYLFVIAPDKESIYPENVPDQYTRLNNNTLLDQLIAYLKKTSDISILDLRPQLLAQKETELLYYPLDSHWNDQAGYIAYKAIIERLQANFSSLQALPRSSFSVANYDAGRDLERIMGLDHVLKVNPSPILRVLTPCASMQQMPTLEKLPLVLDASESTCPVASINAIVIHDSFFNNVDPMLAENFHKAAFIFSPFYASLVKPLLSEIKPNVVIEELLQRKLSDSTQSLPDMTVNSIIGIEAFKLMSHKLLPNNFLTNLFNYQLYEANAWVEGEAVVINAATDDPQIIFSVPEVATNSTIGIRADIEVPEDTVFQVFYACPGVPFSEQHSQKTGLLSGQNDVYLTLTNTCPVSQLRIDPGAAIGKYVIHNLEIRSSPPDVPMP